MKKIEIRQNVIARKTKGEKTNVDGKIQQNRIRVYQKRRWLKKEG